MNITGNIDWKSQYIETQICFLLGLMSVRVTVQQGKCPFGEGYLEKLITSTRSLLGHSDLGS